MFDRRSSSIFAILCVLALLAGCGPANKTRGLSRATEDYHAKRYQQAHAGATEALPNAEGQQREYAAYLAGLSAYQMRNLDEAERHLLVAARSPDATICGDARAMLGMIRMDQRRPREAAAYYADAWSKLSGPDAHEAAYHAGMAYAEARDSAASKKWFDIAAGHMAAGHAPAIAASNSPQVSTPTLASSHTASASSAARAAPAPARSSFALQVGAFTDTARAHRAATDASKLAKSHDLVTARIIPTKDDRGRNLYLVQFGHFMSRSEAAAARAKLGRLDYIVAAIPSAPSTLAAR